MYIYLYLCALGGTITVDISHISDIQTEDKLNGFKGSSDKAGDIQIKITDKGCGMTQVITQLYYSYDYIFVILII